MKDPFAFVIIAVGLVFCENLKEFWRKLVLPSMIGAIIALGFMASVGVLNAYLTIYLPIMVPLKTKGGDSLYAIFARMYDIYDQFIKGYGIFVLALLLLWGIIRLINSKKFSGWLFNIVAVGFALFFALYSAVCGASIYDHQYVLVVAALCAVVVIILKYKRLLPFMLVIVIGISFMLPRGQEYYNATFQNMPIMKERAALVDTVLDEIGEQKYTYIGWISEDSGFQMYSKKTLVGPYICAMFDVLYDINQNSMTQRFPAQLQNTNVVFVMSDINAIMMGDGPLDYMKNYLAENFVDKSDLLPDKAEMFPTGQLFIRKSVVESKGL